MDKQQVHDPTRNVDRPPSREQRQGSRELERDVKRDRKMEQQVDEAGEESFPASDPPAWTSGSSIAAREQKERAPGVSTVEKVDDSSVVGTARAPGVTTVEAGPASDVTDESRVAGAARPAGEARTPERGKARQRPNKSGRKPPTDDEDTLDMARDKADREQRATNATQSGAIPQNRDDDRNQRHEAVRVDQTKQERTHLAPQRTDDRTDMPGRRAAPEGPHEVFPGEPRVTPPKPEPN